MGLTCRPLLLASILFALLIVSAIWMLLAIRQSNETTLVLADRVTVLEAVTADARELAESGSDPALEMRIGLLEGKVISLQASPEVPEIGQQFAVHGIWTEAHDVAIYLLTSRSDPQTAFHLLVERGPMTVDEIARAYPRRSATALAVLEDYMEYFARPLIRYVDDGTVELSEFGIEVARAMDEIPPRIVWQAGLERWVPSGE